MPHRTRDNRDQLLRIEQAAQILSVSKSWLYQNRDSLPFLVRLPSGPLRVSAKKLDLWMQEDIALDRFRPEPQLPHIIATVEDSPSPYCVYTADSSFVYMNEQEGRRLGYTFKERISRPNIEYVHIDDAAFFVDKRAELLRRRGQITAEPVRVQNVEGRFKAYRIFLEWISGFIVARSEEI